MIYLDYSATTKANKEVINSFVDCEDKYFGNANSLHKLGINSKLLIDNATKQIKDILDIEKYDVIYTSGATESNNMVIKCVAEQYKNRGNRILTTNLEHSSIYAPLKYLEKKGFVIDIVNVDENGLIDINDLRKKLCDDTILVCVCMVNSELGITQDINKIGKIINEYNKCFFHVDMTQAIGKINVNFDYVDFASFSAHKFYGIKGIGCLIKKHNIVIEPLISGGDSTTKYRSGTPTTSLIVSLAKALRLANQDLNKKYEYVNQLNKYLIGKLNKIGNIIINSNDYSIPHIVNLSVLNMKPETIVHFLEEADIYISTKSACSSTKLISRSIYALTNSEKISKHSIRISLSHLTTKKEIDYFISYLILCINKFNK